MPTIATPVAAAAFALAPLFTDHMVLQQDRPNQIWGCDSPGSPVVVSVEGPSSARVEVVADADGAWSAVLPALPAGGPYTIVVDGSADEVLDDVLVGEVWLVSGQSNMEFLVSQAMQSGLEKVSAQNPRVRHFRVAQQASDSPAWDVDGEWVVAAPDTVGGFSAIGYYFGRDLAARMDVPVGIINSSWGGTRVEAWMSEAEAARHVSAEELHPTGDVEARRKLAYDRYLEEARVWRLEHMPADPGNFGFARGWAGADFDDSAWGVMDLPGYWQRKGLILNGAVWFRREVVIPASWAGRDLVLSLGAVDDYDTTYFNGACVGEVPRGTPDSYRMLRNYIVPASAVKAGRAVVTVRVFDDFGDGGFGSLASVMQIAPADAPSEGVSIAGDWRFLVEHDIGIVPASVFAGSPGSPADSTPQNQYCRLYNGMINPLVPYGIRGALWYQGEANEGNSGEYGERIRGMIRDWRSNWAQGDFPFYYVQLACYSSVMDWAPLRAAQDEALLEPNTGRALAIDIGNANDIHPTNKQEVARRLALVALADTYGLSGFESRGPEFEGFSVEGARVRVRFSHSSGLHTTGNVGEVFGFEVAGADGVFHRACGRVEGGEVVLSCCDVPAPVSVRYAWESAPSVNLVNGDNLPAAPFNTAR